jgi:hypothetical protein
LVENLQGKNRVLDTEILALLRLAKKNGITNGEILHFNKEYILTLKFEEFFPKEVRVLNKDTKLENLENFYLSGFIPEKILKEANKYKILNNETENPEFNVAYGSLLNPIDNLAVDFSFSKSSELLIRSLKGLLYLFLTVLIINLAILIGIFLKEREIKKVKDAQKEVYIKYISQSGEVYDPLTQAKGLLKTVKSGGGNTGIDPIDLLAEIGMGKKKYKIIDLERIDIYEDGFIIQGEARSLSDIENFKNYLSKNYKVTIDETNKKDNGNIKFILRGSR